MNHRMPKKIVAPLLGALALGPACSTESTPPLLPPDSTTDRAVFEEKALALTLDPIAWSATLSIFGLVSKLALFAITYVALRARVIAARSATPAATIN